jgi:murein DD-endopeptidase MepM/ murein hydrolase activator NlpD
MNNKFYTLLITPGVHGKIRKIQLPFYVVPLVLGLSLAGLAMVAGLATSYARMLVKVSNYNTVRSEREALKKQYHSLEDKVSRTNAKLNSLQSLATEVALTYGFGGSRRLRVTPALLSLASAGNGTLDTSYRSSLFAFDALKTASLDTGSGPLGGTLLPGMLDDPSAVPSIWPVHGRITAGFGERLDPFNGEGAFHPGVDIGASYGADVEAAGDGMVTEAGRDAGYGRSILIDHGDGISTRYAHLSKILVVVGEEVKRGEIIGDVGMSGRTTGPHLHYEVLIHGDPVNPARFLPG